MAEKISPYQLVHFRQFATDMLKQNHIASFFGDHPALVEPLMTKIFEVNYVQSFNMFLQQYPVMRVDSSTSFKHMLYGSGRRNYELKYAKDENGNVVTKNSGMVGSNLARFELVFNDVAFLFGETIIGERREFPLRVVEQPRHEGTDVVYTVEAFNGDTNGIPATLLVPGKRFYNGPYYVAKGLSTEGSGVRHTTPSKIINEFSTIRKTLALSGDVFGEKVQVDIPLIDNETGEVKKVSTWALFEEMEFENQWQEDLSEALWSTVSNKTNSGEYLHKDFSGEKLIKGMGMLEQLRASNVYYYSKFTLKQFNDVVYKFPNGTEVVVFTGKEGARQAHEKIGEQASGYTNITVNADALGMVSKTQSDYHPNAFKTGFMFTEWISPTGVTIKFKVLDFYDDPVKGILTLNNRPADSYRYDILELGPGVEKNICKVEPSYGASASGMSWGFKNTQTLETWNPNMSFGVDMTKYEKFARLGVLVKDPTRCVVMLPSIYGTMD